MHAQGESSVCLVRLTHRKIWREFQISEARGFAFLGNVNALSQAFLRGAGLLTTHRLDTGRVDIGFGFSKHCVIYFAASRGWLWLYTGLFYFFLKKVGQNLN